MTTRPARVRASQTRRWTGAPGSSLIMLMPVPGPWDLWWSSPLWQWAFWFVVVGAGYGFARWYFRWWSRHGR